MLAFVFLIKLRKACRHFARTGTGCGYDYEISRSFDIIVFPVALFAHDKRNIVRVALYGIVPISFYAERSKLCLEGFSGFVFLGELRENDAPDKQTVTFENFDKAENVEIVSYAEIGSHFVSFDVVAVDDDNDFGSVFEFTEHLNLVVGRKAGKNARSVKIVEEFSAELYI